MELTQQNLKSLMNEYNIPNDMFNDTDEFQLLIKKINKLPIPDRIILYLYAETKSYRKLAKILNVSFATAYKSINKIRKQIL